MQLGRLQQSLEGGGGWRDVTQDGMPTAAGRPNLLSLRHRTWTGLASSRSHGERGGIQGSCGLCLADHGADVMSGTHVH